LIQFLIDYTFGYPLKFFGDFLFVLSNNDNIGAVLIANNLFSFLAKSNIADTTFPSNAVL